MANNSSGKINITGKGSALKEYTDQLEKSKQAGQRLKKSQLKDLQAYDWKLEVENIENAAELRKKAEKEASEIRKKHYEQEGHVIKASIEDAFGTAEKTLETISSALDFGVSTVKSVTSQLDSVIDKYVEKQQSMTAHLTGSGSTLADITNTLNTALSSTSLIKQESIYANLSKLVNSGIVYNVEQRAFLETVADDLNMAFKAENQSMNRLIRILGADITSSRVAMEYSLQAYLNSNYQTSEYIKDAMVAVSNNLTSSQSLMSVSDALSYESAIQNWLGAYYSSGISSNTVTGIASALDQLSRGDISGLGSGLSNLVLMGVARANGLDYGSLMNNNLTSSDVNSIMQGVTSYIKSMSGYSNVAKSQLANLFGIDVSDIAAISKLDGVGGTNTNISSLLGNYNSLVPFPTQVNNALSNFMYSWGTNIATGSGVSGLMAYTIEKMVANTLGEALSSTTLQIGALGSSVMTNIGKAIQMAPLLALVPNLISSVSDVASSIGSGSWNDMTQIFNSLGSTTVTGSGTTVSISGSGTSGSMYVSSGNTDDIAKNSLNSATSSIDTESLAGDQQTTEDLINMVNDSVLQIYDLLEDRLDVKLSSVSQTAMISGVLNATVF